MKLIIGRVDRRRGMVCFVKILTAVPSPSVILVMPSGDRVVIVLRVKGYISLFVLLVNEDGQVWVR